MSIKKDSINNISIKAKSIILVLGVLILVSLLLAWRLVLYKDSELISKIENHHIYLTKVQKLSVTRAKEKLLSHLITIDSSKEFLYSIKNKNREYLNNYMQPIYRKLQNNLQNMVDIYSIYLPKGTSFLRLHKPDIYGDNNLNSRPLLREVSKTKKITSGYEAGKFGLFYRIEYPVIYNSELVAIIDIGLSLKKLDLTLETIKKVSAVNLFSYKPVHKFQDKSSYNFENEFMLEGDEQASEILYKNGSKNIIHNSIINHKNKVFVVHILSTSDNAGNELSRKIYFIDITEEYASNKKDIWIYIAISLFVIIILTFILLRGFNTILEQLLNSENRYKQLAQDLDKKVHDQTLYIIQQSRLAQLGEMISMIAHQWRQPLSSISTIAANMKVQLDLNKYDLSITKESNECKDLFTKKLVNIEEMVKTLSLTINDFRNFYKPNKEKIKTSINTPLSKALNIIKSSLKYNKITVVEDYHSNKEIEIFENELMHVFINIIKNSVDNFKDKKTSKPKIIITTQELDNNIIIKILDNGGGIKDDIKNKIFDPYFSTKNSKNGTGLGLYMSKTIVEEHHNGKLTISNTRGGVCFTIKLFQNL